MAKEVSRPQTARPAMAPATTSTAWRALCSTKVLCTSTISITRLASRLKWVNAIQMPMMMPSTKARITSLLSDCPLRCDIH
ncbi:hypothetical protein D3C72_1942260 [compost metagenome]